MSQTDRLAASSVVESLFARIASITGAEIAAEVREIPPEQFFPAALTKGQIGGVEPAADWIGRWLRDNVETLPAILRASDLLPALRAYYEEFRTALCPPIIEALSRAAELEAAA